MIDAIAQTQALEQEIKQLTRAKANALHLALADIEMLLRTVADAWNEMKDKTREKLEQRAAAHGVKFDDEGCLGYQEEHSVEGLLWWLGNHLPLYNESCEPIVDYQIVQNEAEVATWVAGRRRYISVTYQEQDGFEFDLPLDLMDAFDYADIDQWKEQFLTTLRPKGRRFLLQDANVLAQQCFSPRSHRGRARCHRHCTSIVLFLPCRVHGMARYALDLLVLLDSRVANAYTKSKFGW